MREKIEIWNLLPETDKSNFKIDGDTKMSNKNIFEPRNKF